MDEKTVTKEEFEYRPVETLFAWLSLLAGYGFCRVVPSWEHPFAALMLILVVYAVTAILFKAQNIKLSFMPICTLVSVGVIAVSLFFSGSSFIHFFSYWFSLCAYLYFVMAAMGNCIEPGFSPYILTDFIKALFVMPFSSFGKIFGALGSIRRQKGAKGILKALLGLVIAVVPVTIIIALLSYDAGFKKIIDSILRFENFDLKSHFLSVLFGIPIGMYIFGAFISNTRHSNADVFSAESCQKKAEKRRGLSVITVVSAVVPILAVYVIYFISQWGYYVSGFSGVLPKGFSYAEYCREGFFELCTVSAINFLLMTGVSRYMKQQNKSAQVICKVICLMFCVLSLILISTAMSKMAMYIENYGLTTSRVYASWFMLVLAVLFALVIIRQFAPRFKLVPVAVAAVVVLYAALALSGVNTRIAKHNVDRYIDGTLKKVDVVTLYELGDDAVPELVRLQEYVCEQKGIDVQTVTKAGASNAYDESVPLEQRIAYFLTCASDSVRDIWTLTLPQMRAKAALESIGYEYLFYMR